MNNLSNFNVNKIDNFIKITECIANIIKVTECIINLLNYSNYFNLDKMANFIGIISIIGAIIEVILILSQIIQHVIRLFNTDNKKFSLNKKDRFIELINFASSIILMIQYIQSINT